MDNQRTYFRLEYPPVERPRLRLDSGEFAVFDLSEKGLKFDCGAEPPPADGSRLKGTVIFRDGKACQVAGTVLRYDAGKNQCVIALIKGIPLAKMMEEQRHLLKKYKS